MNKTCRKSQERFSSIEPEGQKGPRLFNDTAKSNELSASTVIHATPGERIFTKIASQYGICSKFNQSPIKGHIYEDQYVSQTNKKMQMYSPGKTIKPSSKLAKVDIQHLAMYLDLVPDIKGIRKHQLMQLYVAKCQDLKINVSKA